MLELGRLLASKTSMAIGDMLSNPRSLGRTVKKQSPRWFTIMVWVHLVHSLHPIYGFFFRFIVS